MSADAEILEGIVTAIHKVKLEAVIVGNTASALHGAPVLTEDVDIVIRDTPLNRKKLVRLAEELGGANPAEISELISAKRIMLPESYLDVIFDKIAGGLRFESLRAHAERMQIGSVSIDVASLEDVIKSKRAANRKKDQAVLPILEDTLAVNNARKKR
jgi:predicted nucleotidyltransferase